MNYRFIGHPQYSVRLDNRYNDDIGILNYTGDWYSKVYMDQYFIEELFYLLLIFGLDLFKNIARLLAP